MPTTLMLDDTGDLLCANYDDGTNTIFVAKGKEQVAQAASIAVALKQGRVWFNLGAGTDYMNLFFNANKPDVDMESIRATAIRTALFSVPGITGFKDSNAAITFERSGRVLKPNVPCVLIDCENSLTSSFIGVLE